jgi:spore germination protein KB
MSIEKGKISPSLLFFLALGFIQGSTLTVGFISGTTKQNSWLGVLGGFLLSLPFVWINVTLMSKFASRNLVQIHDLVYGPILGKFISVLYISYFLMLISINLRGYGDWFLIFIMPETPLIVFIIGMSLTCAFTINKGLEVLARTVVLYVLTASAIFILDNLLVISNMKFTNFLPLMAVPLKDLFKGMYTMAAIPFSETVIFMMIVPYTQKAANAKKGFVYGSAAGAIYLLLTALRDIAVLGNLYPVVTSPTYETVRMINLIKVFTRMELVAALGLLILQFIKISICYYGTVVSIAQLLGLRSYKPLILPIGGLAVGLAVLIVGSNMEQAYSASHYYPVFSSLFEFILPVLTFITAMIRGLPKN